MVIISPGGRCPFKDDAKKTGDQILFFYYYLSNSSLVHGGVGVQRDFALVVVWGHRGASSGSQSLRGCCVVIPRFIGRSNFSIILFPGYI